MKILISTLGSRGDTQPYLALAVGLKEAGYHLTLAAPRNFIELIQSYGVSAHPLRFNPQEAMQSIMVTKDPLEAMLSMRKVMKTRVTAASHRRNIIRSHSDHLE